MNQETQGSRSKAGEATRIEPLELNKETLHDLSEGEAGGAKGGMLPETRWTYCGQGGPTECYKPNPY